jgi:geranylgeranyl diphosphate synthase type I
MVWRKSGTLITASLVGGAAIAGANEQVIKILKEYGRKIGTAFQIKDDILNLVGDQEKYGKEIGGDIKEGKRTLIMIHCLSNCNKNEKIKLLEILKKSREAVTIDDVNFAMDLVKKYGSIEFTLKHSNELIENAKQLLVKISNVKLRMTLEKFADFMVKREY